MKAHKSLLILFLATSLFACEGKPTAETPAKITFSSASLYPEGVEWDASGKRFLVSSLRKGEIGSVKDDGTYQVFAKDPRMVSSVGMEIDAPRDRVLVCNSDPGAGEKASKETTGKLAALAVFQLSTGKLLQYIDLAQALPGGHFCNDIAIAKDGTAYITDSFSPIIYKVDSQYNASVLINDQTFSGNSFNLNGIVVKDNYLLVVKMNSGQLFKIPLDDPKAFSEVKVNADLKGADGLLWGADGTLILIANNNTYIGIPNSTANNTVMRLASTDDWKTATVKGKVSTGDVFATTGTLRDGQIYVVHAMLHVLFNPETKQHLDKFDIVKYAP